MLSSTRPFRILALLVLVAIANVYVFAAGATGNVTATTGKALLGKLITTSNRPVVVNGSEAITGTIIVSGAQVTTSGASTAMVELNSLGSVMIAPNSSVVLTFDAKNVNANVVSGYASVATTEGVKGSVTGLPANAAAPAPAGGNSAKNWGIAGVGIGSAALIWAIVSWNKANNAEDDALAAQASAASLATQLAALRTCLANQTSANLCKSF